jgi:predicted MFS family arabinose efflux permease
VSPPLLVDVPDGSRPPALARYLAGRGIHYGWAVVVGVFLTVLLGAGARSAVGVLVLPLEEDFGWSRSAISAVLSVSLVLVAVAGPLSGEAINRWGLRRAVVGFLTVGVVGSAACALMQSYWQFVISWGLLVGLGTGGISLVVGGVVANTWFAERRGLVAGILGGAASAGQLVLIKLLDVVTDASGWRTSLWLVTAILGACIPLCWWLLRARPADVDQQPYGNAAAVASHAADTRKVPLRDAARTADLWLLAGSFFVCGFTTIGLIGYHFVPHAVEHGIAKGDAASILSLLGGMNIVGTLVSGWLCDRYPARLLLALYYLLRGVALLALPAISGVPFLSAFAVVFGLDYIATVPATISVISERFGPRSIPVLYGFVIFLHMIGAAVSAVLAGALHDWLESYTEAFYLGGVLAVAAAAMSFAISYRRTEEGLSAASA